MRAPAWLTARPVAHRGLHDASAGVIENTTSAFAAAIAGRYAIECDVQVSADGEAMVYHDDALGRLTEGGERLADLDAARLMTVPFRQTADRMITLGDLCDFADGRVPLVIEIKSRFDGDPRLTDRAAAVLAAYRGPAALMSFDPALVARLRHRHPSQPRGVVAERHYDHAEWAALPAGAKWRMAHLLHAVDTRPHFIAYGVRDLPAPATRIARALGVPVLTWTVRTAEDRARAARHADQVIFEGWRP